MSSTNLALLHEIRSALNLIELALSSHEKRDVSLRDHLVRSIQLPLLESKARGDLGGGADGMAVSKMVESIPRESLEDAEMLDEPTNLIEVDAHALASRVTARMESMRVLASHPREIQWIRWHVRLDRVKHELTAMLEKVMEKADQPMAAGVGR